MKLFEHVQHPLPTIEARPDQNGVFKEYKPRYLLRQLGLIAGILAVSVGTVKGAPKAIDLLKKDPVPAAIDTEAPMTREGLGSIGTWDLSYKKLTFEKDGVEPTNAEIADYEKSLVEVNPDLQDKIAETGDEIRFPTIR